MGHSTRRLLPSAAWALLMASGPVQADHIIQMRDYRVVTAGTSPVVGLTFDQFDPRLGTLLGVEFVFQFEVQSVSIDFENTEPIPRVVDIGVQHIVNYLGPGMGMGGAPPVFDGVSLFRGPVSFGPFDGRLDFAGPDSFAFRQATPAGNTRSAVPTSLPPYVGDSTVPLTIRGVTSASFSNFRPRIRFNGSELSGVVTLRYDFEPVAVAEPSVLSLAGIGVLICLGLTLPGRWRTTLSWFASSRTQRCT